MRVSWRPPPWASGPPSAHRRWASLDPTAAQESTHPVCLPSLYANLRCRGAGCGAATVTTSNWWHCEPRCPPSSSSSSSPVCSLKLCPCCTQSRAPGRAKAGDEAPGPPWAGPWLCCSPAPPSGAGSSGRERLLPGQLNVGADAQLESPWRACLPAEMGRPGEGGAVARTAGQYS